MKDVVKILPISIRSETTFALVLASSPDVWHPDPHPYKGKT